MSDQVLMDYSSLEPSGADSWCPILEKEMYHRFRLTWAIRCALMEVKAELSQIRALDVGCGLGRSTAALLEFGIQPTNIMGIDLRDWAIETAQRRYLGIQFKTVRGVKWTNELGMFDFVMQCTVFSSIRSLEERKLLADAVSRITKPNGVFLWWDRCRANSWAGGDGLRPSAYFERELWAMVSCVAVPVWPLVREAVQGGVLVGRLARLLQAWLGHRPTHVAAVYRRLPSSDLGKGTCLAGSGSQPSAAGREGSCA